MLGIGNFTTILLLCWSNTHSAQIRIWNLMETINFHLLLTCGYRFCFASWMGKAALLGDSYLIARVCLVRILFFEFSVFWGVLDTPFFVQCPFVHLHQTMSAWEAITPAGSILPHILQGNLGTPRIPYPHCFPTPLKECLSFINALYISRLQGMFERKHIFSCSGNQRKLPASLSW